MGHKTAVTKSSSSQTQVAGEIWLCGNKTGQSRTAAGPLTMNVTEHRFWCEPNRIEAHIEIPAVSSGHRGLLHVSQGQTGRDLNTDGQTDASDLHPKHRARIRRAFFTRVFFFGSFVCFYPERKGRDPAARGLQWMPWGREPEDPQVPTAEQTQRTFVAASCSGHPGPPGQ